MSGAWEGEIQNVGAEMVGVCQTSLSLCGLALHESSPVQLNGRCSFMLWLRTLKQRSLERILRTFCHLLCPSLRNIMALPNSVSQSSHRRTHKLYFWGVGGRAGNGKFLENHMDANTVAIFVKYNLPHQE